MHGTFVPYFFLQENFGSRDQRNHEVVIPDDKITDMCSRGRFSLYLQIDALYQSSMTRLSLCLQPDSYGPYHDPMEPLLPISGFPRELCTQDNISARLDEDDENDSDDENDGISELAGTPVMPPLPHAKTEPDTSKLQSPRRFFNRRRPKSDQESGLYKSKNWSNSSIPVRERPIPADFRPTNSNDSIETRSIVSSEDNSFSAEM